MNCSWPLLALTVLATKAIVWSNTEAYVLELEENSLVREKSFGGNQQAWKDGRESAKKGWKWVRLRCTGVPLSRWGYYCCHCLPRHSPLLPQPQWHQCPILSTPLSSSGSCQAWVEGCGLTSAGWKIELYQQGLTMGLGICHLLGSLWLEICRDKAFWNPGCCLISIEEIMLLESKDDWKTTSSVRMSIMPTAKSSSKVGLFQTYLFLRKAFPNSPYCSSDKAFEPTK